MDQLGKVIISPAPKRGKNLEEYANSVEQWTRQTEQAVRTLEAHIRLLQDQLQKKGVLT